MIVVLEYHIDCLDPSLPDHPGSQPCVVIQQPAEQSTGCCSVSSHIRNLLATTQHPFPCPGQSSSSSHSTDVGPLLPGSTTASYNCLAHLTSSLARAMTRLLISIFSPRFITKTTALSCDLLTRPTARPQTVS